MVVSSAPGKINLTGEYGSIYGKLVTLASVSLRTKVSAQVSNDSFFILSSDNSDKKIQLSIDELRSTWFSARAAWEEFDKSNNLDFLRPFRSRELIGMILAAGQVLSMRPSVNRGMELIATSDLPVGSGLGSSSAIVAATTGAIMAELNFETSAETINKMTYSVEEIMHGRPSGGDNTGVVYGGLMKFRRVEQGSNFVQKIDYPNVLPKCLLIQSGKPLESTAEMVAKVRESYIANPPLFSEYMDQIGEIGEKFQAQLEQGNFATQYLQQNQLVLERIGIVGSMAMKIIRTIVDSGGVAKVCGAGGFKAGSGIILAAHQNEKVLLELVKNNNWEHYSVQIGGLGWKIEK